MAEDTRKQIEEALEGGMIPQPRRSIVQLGMVRDIKVEDGKVNVTLSLTPLSESARASIEKEARVVLGKVPGVSDVAIEVVELPVKEMNEISAVRF